MKKIQAFVISVFAFVVLFSLHQLTSIVFERHGWKGMAPADWSSWIQAFGSLAAIYGALWIYYHQTKAAANASLITAKIAAAKLMPQIASFSGELVGMARKLDFQQQVDQGAAFLKSESTKLSSHGDWPIDEISRLAPLPNDCAEKLSIGLGFISAARRLLAGACENDLIERDPNFRRGVATKVSFLLTQGATLLQQSAKIMQTQLPVLATLPTPPP